MVLILFLPATIYLSLILYCLDYGLSQIEDKRPQYEELEIDLVVVSPLTRAIQTCMGLLAHRKVYTD